MGVAESEEVSCGWGCRIFVSIIIILAIYVLVLLTESLIDSYWDLQERLEDWKHGIEYYYIAVKPLSNTSTLILACTPDGDPVPPCLGNTSGLGFIVVNESISNTLLQLENVKINGGDIVQIAPEPREKCATTSETIVFKAKVKVERR